MAHAVSDDAAWHALIKDRSLQFQFPQQPRTPPPPGWLIRLADFLRAHEVSFRYGAWVLLGIVMLALAWWLVRLYLRHGFSSIATVHVPTMAPWQPSPERARLLLADADALAGEGRYAEAAHLLLRIAIQEIGERRPGAVMPSLTAREIAGLEVLSPRARDVFASIAAVVERCLFGGRALAQGDFALCRAAFERFTVPDAWAPSATGRA
jgi:hypothetical protein